MIEEVPGVGHRSRLSSKIVAKAQRASTPPARQALRGRDLHGPPNARRGFPNLTEPAQTITVTLLTGGSDRPYVFGLTTSLISREVHLDIIGSDELDYPVFHRARRVNFLKLRGSQRPDVSFAEKLARVSVYYSKLISYAATARPRIFHILWNNRFETFDRTLLMLFYRLLGKKIVLTAHNVNAGKRDSMDSRLNRLTLGIQYRLSDHIFVHTEKMKQELIQQFGVQGRMISVIPFGINNSVPNTSLTPRHAKQRLGVRESEKAILFFGRITPYKGLEYLIAAVRQLMARHEDYRLIIAGRPDRCDTYWSSIREAMREELQSGRVLLRAEFIPDEETEVYFKAADVVVLPYKNIYQSGVLFLGHSFGLPVLAADVGSLKDDIVEGKLGFVFRPEDPVDLAKTIERYFASDLYAKLDIRRPEIRDSATEQHSWDVVGEKTINVYASLLGISVRGKASHRDTSSASVDSNSPASKKASADLRAL
jgi:D-inositol-3-phosphate glycosyltransferase